MTSAHVVEASLEFYRQQYFSGPLWELGFTFLFIVKQLRNYFILFSFNWFNSIHKWFSKNRNSLVLQQLVYAVTAKNTKVKCTSQAWNGTIYVGCYVTTLTSFRSNLTRNSPGRSRSRGIRHFFHSTFNTGRNYFCSLVY